MSSKRTESFSKTFHFTLEKVTETAPIFDVTIKSIVNGQEIVRRGTVVGPNSMNIQSPNSICYAIINPFEIKLDSYELSDILEDDITYEQVLPSPNPFEQFTPKASVPEVPDAPKKPAKRGREFLTRTSTLICNEELEPTPLTSRPKKLVDIETVQDVFPREPLAFYRPVFLSPSPPLFNSNHCAYSSTLLRFTIRYPGSSSFTSTIVLPC